MATPNYKGTSQPVASSGGWLSGMGSWFGASAPAYAPAPTKTAAAVPTASNVTTGTTSDVGVVCEPDRITLVIPRSLIDTQALAAYVEQDGDAPACDAERITLVIPRSVIQSQQ
ncbi:MAG: hypothetical protein NT062_10975 [Proteobacteria bacterium]|nr:hypothetical protein [Pseudomonadota bacterium]